MMDTAPALTSDQWTEAVTTFTAAFEQIRTVLVAWWEQARHVWRALLTVLGLWQGQHRRMWTVVARKRTARQRRC